MPYKPTDEELLELIKLKELHGTFVAGALAAGLSESTFKSRIKQATLRGLNGFKPVPEGFEIKQIATKEDGSWVKMVPEAGPLFELQPWEKLKGRSILVDADGRMKAGWMKTKESDVDLGKIVEWMRASFDDVQTHHVPVPAPEQFSEHLLTLIACNDWHINMLAWEQEVGENWDLKIAEGAIGGAIETAIMRAPKAKTAIVLGGGDLLHADNKDARTAASGHALDVDGRYQKGVDCVMRLMVRTVDAALANNESVIVRILPGNHDEHTSVAVTYYLLAWYRNDPRVTVDTDASLFFWHRHGLTMLGSTHGHMVKIDKMPGIMAHRRASDWGQTKYRYVHGFHLHHKEMRATEGDGVVTEVHQAPIPQDAWHYGSGFLSGRSVQTISYDDRYGEVSRTREVVMDA